MDSDDGWNVVRLVLWVCFFGWIIVLFRLLPGWTKAIFIVGFVALLWLSNHDTRQREALMVPPLPISDEVSINVIDATSDGVSIEATNIGAATIHLLSSAIDCQLRSKVYYNQAKRALSDSGTLIGERVISVHALIRDYHDTELLGGNTKRAFYDYTGKPRLQGNEIATCAYNRRSNGSEHPTAEELWVSMTSEGKNLSNLYNLVPASVIRNTPLVSEPQSIPASAPLSNGCQTVSNGEFRIMSCYNRV